MIKASLRTVTVIIIFLANAGSSVAQTIAQNQEIDLVGTWNLNVGYFNMSSSGDCTVRTLTTDRRAFNGPTRIDRSGSGYSISINQPVSISVSGDQMSFVENSRNGSLRWEGTISRIVDSQTPVTVISGIETCNNQVTLPFTMIRMD